MPYRPRQPDRYLSRIGLEANDEDPSLQDGEPDEEEMPYEDYDEEDFPSLPDQLERKP